VSVDSRKPHVFEFHQECEPFFHTLNIYTERISPSVSLRCQELWEQIRNIDEHGYLRAVKSCYFSHAVLFNAGSDAPDLPKKDKYHKDKHSCWSGFDAVGVFGEYDNGELDFPGLGYSFISRPGDLFFLRGAAFSHGAINWTGAGRMVFAMFCDKHVFLKRTAQRPRDLHRIYGGAHSKLRRQYPIKPRESLIIHDSDDIWVEEELEEGEIEEEEDE